MIEWSNIQWSNTGIYILPTNGHSHCIMDPGHHHEDNEVEKTHLEIGPAIDVNTGQPLDDSHTHEVIDRGHKHITTFNAIRANIELSVTNGHTHEVRDWGHRHT